MGEAKRRKKLGVSPRKKNLKPNFPELDKKAIQKKYGLLYINIQ